MPYVWFQKHNRTRLLSWPPFLDRPGYSALLAAFKAGATGVLIDPTDTLSLYTTSAGTTFAENNGDPVGLGKNLANPGTMDEVQSSDPNRPILSVTGSRRKLTYDGSTEFSRITLSAGAWRSNVAIMVGINTIDTQGIVLSGQDTSRFLAPWLQGSGDTSLAVNAGTPTLKVLDGRGGTVAVSTRGELHAAITAAGPRVVVLRNANLAVSGFAWTEAKYSGFSGVWRINGDRGALLIIEDSALTAQLEASCAAEIVSKMS